MECSPTVELSWDPAQVSSTIYWRLLLKRGRGLTAGKTVPNFLARATMRPDKSQLKRYRELTALRDDGHLPLLFPHVMMGSAHLEMMAHAQFPLSASGMLHLRNHVVRAAPIPDDVEVELECRLARQRIVEKGLEFEIDSELRVGGELKWSSISTLFKRGKFGKGEGESELAGLFPKLEQGKDSEPIEVPADVGKRYAAISGDRNPIHTSNLMAKLFGFKRAIAHGMWTSARVLPAVAPELPAACRFDVAFKGPVFVGSRVRTRGNANRFDTFCGGNDRPVICARLLANTGWGEKKTLEVTSLTRFAGNPSSPVGNMTLHTANEMAMFRGEET